MPQFANVHSNITPLILGIVLLVPGSLVTFTPVDRVLAQIPAAAQCVAISLVNLPLWYLLWWINARPATKEPKTDTENPGPPSPPT